MNIFQSIILGLVQGLTEFLPVSSSGHLVIIPKLFSWTEHTLVFDTTLHLGTSLALIVFFFNDIKSIVLDFIKDINKYITILLKGNTKNSKEKFNLSSNTLLGFKLLVGCLPAIVFGFIFGDYLEQVFRDIPWVILFLSIGSVLMFVAEYYKGNKNNKEEVKDKSNNRVVYKSLSTFSFKDSLLVGIFQSLALLPGMSRSGSTISGGMLLGLNKEDSARFSFLLSIPIILGVGIYQLISNPIDVSNIQSLIIGFVFSFISGLVAIRFLLSFLKSNTLYPFVIYRFILAVTLLIYTL